MKQRATALTNSQLLDQLCYLLIPKLEKRLATLLSSKHRVVTQNPPQPTTAKGKNEKQFRFQSPSEDRDHYVSIYLLLIVSIKASTLVSSGPISEAS